MLELRFDNTYAFLRAKKIHVRLGIMDAQSEITNDNFNDNDNNSEHGHEYEYEYEHEHDNMNAVDEEQPKEVVQEDVERDIVQF